jgi:hypothetical protein
MPKQKLEKINWAEVESSNISATYFDDRTDTICVRFNNGGLYTYMGSHKIYTDFVNSSSMGKYLHDVIKSLCPYTRMNDEAELLDYLNI